MKCRRLLIPVGVVLAAFTLSGCDTPPRTAQEQADAATRAACQKRAEQTYEQQNRGAIYSPGSSVNSPYSANYVPDVADRGLSDLFAHDRVVSDCVRNTGTGTDRRQPTLQTPAR